MTAPRPPKRSFEATNPLLADVIERNIHTIMELRHQSAAQRTPEERTSDQITVFSGSMRYVYIHILWFGIWMVINLGWLGLPVFDPFPFGLLTMIVSLEAIFLATFVLISQNRLSAEADRRADLDLQIGLLTEYQLTHVLKMLNTIQDTLGIDNEKDPELAALERSVRPEDVLEEMDRVRKLHLS